MDTNYRWRDFMTHLEGLGVADDTPMDPAVVERALKALGLTQGRSKKARTLTTQQQLAALTAEVERLNQFIKTRLPTTTTRFRVT